MMKKYQLGPQVMSLHHFFSNAASLWSDHFQYTSLVSTSHHDALGIEKQASSFLLLQVTPAVIKNLSSMIRFQYYHLCTNPN